MPISVTSTVFVEYALLLQFDVKGRNFLHVAIQKGDLESVLFLLSVCVDVNSRLHDSTQMTPLHLAVVSGNEMILRNLVRLLNSVVNSSRPSVSKVLVCGIHCQ